MFTREPRPLKSPHKSALEVSRNCLYSAGLRTHTYARKHTYTYGQAISGTPRQETVGTPIATAEMVWPSHVPSASPSNERTFDF
jgi:hypothetical protein